MISSSYIKELALKQGFSLCGIARVRSLDDHLTRLEKWIDKGFCSSLGYLVANKQKRSDPSLLVEGAKTVIVCAVNYKNQFWDQSALISNKIASYAYARDYHLTVKTMLRNILQNISEKYAGMKGRCFTDTAPILEKAWAVEAGLGWIGRNSLLVTPQFGSFVLLGEIVICEEVDSYDKPFIKNGCGNCRACIENCPNKAIIPDMMIDTRKCISRLTIEKINDKEQSLSDDLHGWIFGCDQCQSCCPYNTATPLAMNEIFKPVLDSNVQDPQFWKNLRHDEFDRIFGETPLTRAGYEVLKKRTCED